MHQNDITMDAVLETKAHLGKKAHVFRLSTHLLDRLKELAAKDRRSLNNYVEGLLLDAVYNEPNATTITSFEEAKAGHLEGLPISRFMRQDLFFNLDIIL